MPTVAAPLAIEVSKILPETLALALSERWWMREVKFPTVIYSPSASTRVRVAPF